MPTRMRSIERSTQRPVKQPARIRDVASSILDNGDDDDDPLALTPIRPTRTQRLGSRTADARTSEVRSSKGIRRYRETNGVDRVVAGVQLDASDLVPPSDDEEFDQWAEEKISRAGTDRGSATISRRSSTALRSSAPLEASPTPFRLNEHRAERILATQFPAQKSSAASISTASTAPLLFSFFSSNEDSSATEESEDSEEPVSSTLSTLERKSSAAKFCARTQERKRRKLSMHNSVEDVTQGPEALLGHPDPLETPLTRSATAFPLTPIRHSTRPSIPHIMAVVGSDIETTSDAKPKRLSQSPEREKSVQQTLIPPNKPSASLPFTPARGELAVSHQSQISPLSVFNDSPARSMNSELTQYNQLANSSPAQYGHTEIPGTTNNLSQVVSAGVPRSYSPAIMDHRQFSPHSSSAGTATGKARDSARSTSIPPAGEAGPSRLGGAPYSPPLPLSRGSPARSSPLAPPPIDARLQQYRSSRTFRTRTALQLQPYTKEKQVYEAALRRRGLAVGKTAIALPKEIDSLDNESAEENGADQGGDSSPLSELSDDPEKIVIGQSDGQAAVKRRYRQLDISELDMQDFYLSMERQPDRVDEEDEAILQRIARRRRKEDLREMKRLREERTAERRLQSLIGQDHIVTIGQTASTVYRRVKERRTSRAARSTSDELSHPPKIPSPLPSPEFQMPKIPSPLPTQHSLSPGGDEPFIDHTSPPFEHDFNPPDYEPQLLSDSSSSSSGQIVKDKRVRIAHRMMPAAMLKKLEQEAAEKQQRAKAKTQPFRPRSTQMPGIAVRRRGDGGEMNFTDFINDVASDEDDNRPVDSNHSFSDNPIAVSSDGAGSDSSQAEEDNRYGQTLARLYDGDFESIVQGRRPMAGPKRRRHSRPAHHPKIHSSKQGRRPRHQDLIQSKLDFTPNENVISKSGVTNGALPTSPRRPVIKLSDRMIFSTRDVNLSPDFPRPLEKASKAVPHGKKQAKEKKRETNLFQEAIDADIGRGKSWANFEKFSVNFDISPLPSGLSCTGFPFDDSRMLFGSSSGHLQDLADELESTATSHNIVRILVEIHSLCLAGVSEKIVDSMSLRALRSIYVCISENTLEHLDLDIMHVKAGLQEIQNAIQLLLDTHWTNTKSDREKWLAFLWYLFVIEVKLRAPEENDASMTVAAGRLVRYLLLAGFDKAMKPLKIVLKGESVSSHLNDTLTCLWVSIISLLDDMEMSGGISCTETVIQNAISQAFSFDTIGPIASERIWFITLGLCAISQFNILGRIEGDHQPRPRWSLVRKALGMIKIAYNEEAEEKARSDLLRGRDRYIHVMLSRCVLLSEAWKWEFDRNSFSLITRDIGILFKNRQYRNFPTEPAVDYPIWIASFDVTRMESANPKEEAAFEIFLRLVFTAADDMLVSAQSLDMAQQYEKDIQRLVMSIIPISPVHFNRLLPPTPKQLGQLINRYSTMIAACFFSPSILTWLLINSQKWVSFNKADFDSRQICIRGLMYLAVACRHHNQSLESIVKRFAEILTILGEELSQSTDNTPAATNSRLPTKFETQRTMVLVVSCIKQIIRNQSFNPHRKENPQYPDPSLLDPSWTTLIFDLSIMDHRSAFEIIGTIQTFLHARSKALPDRVKRMREPRKESEDSYGSFGFDLDTLTVAQLGGGGGQEVDTAYELDERFAKIAAGAITPRIYRLLSDLLPAVEDESRSVRRQDKEALLSVLIDCWFDCAVAVVVDHRLMDWSAFIGPYGQQSWTRFGNEEGRTQIGLKFMNRLAQMDSTAFIKYPDAFIGLFYSVIGSFSIELPFSYIDTLFEIPGCTQHPLFEGIPVAGFSLETFHEDRISVLDVVLGNMAVGFRTARIGLPKPFLYRCVNDFLQGIERSEKNIPDSMVLHKEEYQAMVGEMVKLLQRHLGNYINAITTPSLKRFLTRPL